MLIPTFLYLRFLPESHKPAPDFLVKGDSLDSWGRSSKGSHAFYPLQGRFPDPWFLLAPSALHPSTQVLNAASYWGLPQISRVGGGDSTLFYGKTGSLRLQGQRSEGIQRAGKRRGQRRGRSVPVSGFEAGHLESLRDSPEIQGFDSWDQTARLPDLLWPDPDYDLLNLPLSCSYLSDFGSSLGKGGSSPI